MIYRFLEEDLDYDGSQLHSLFAYLGHNILGDSIVAFLGACDIPFEHMVDGEDLLARSEIRGARMLHFILEEFGQSLELAVTKQRLFAGIALEEINKIYLTRLEMGPQSGQQMELRSGVQPRLFRSGDDLYCADQKLSISIATISPVSSLIHFAMNVTNENTPVKTLALNDLTIDPREIADKIGKRFVEEIKTIREACCKVNWVK